ncbi:hypothetical protein J6590_102358 [Homalodisca vitripennis]|nr:hypothetical protein J6590_102358 [Homalodisca vitripennis]
MRPGWAGMWRYQAQGTRHRTINIPDVGPISLLMLQLSGLKLGTSLPHSANVCPGSARGEGNATKAIGFTYT